MSFGCRYDESFVSTHKLSCRTTAAGLPPWDRMTPANGKTKLSRKHIVTVISFWRPAFDIFGPPSLGLLSLGYMQNSWASSPPSVLFFRNRCRLHAPLLSLVMPLHSCQDAPLNSCSLVFHQHWPLHCLSQLTPHLLACEVPPGWRILQVTGEWTTASWLLCSGCQSAMHTPSPHPLHLTQFARVWSMHVRKCIIDLWATRSWVESGFLTLYFEEALQVCVSGSCHYVFWDLQTKLLSFRPQVFSPSLFHCVSSVFRLVL